MTQLDLELSAELIAAVRKLAERHYGDTGDAAVAKVIDAAVQLRVLWLDVGGAAAREVDEPVTHWTAESRAGEGSPPNVKAWLFHKEAER